ncbi:hypothetical protein K443DRAFT_114170, partial [Laccaria amethystina LaAM-08-1]
GSVVQKLKMRKGEMVNYETEEDRWVKVLMEVPARGLIGYMAGEFKNDIHGQGTINPIFKGYEPYRVAIDTGRNGALISMAAGESSGCAMVPLQARGVLFIHQRKVRSVSCAFLPPSPPNSLTLPPTSLPITLHPGMVIDESLASRNSSPTYEPPGRMRRLYWLRRGL